VAVLGAFVAVASVVAASGQAATPAAAEPPSHVGVVCSYGPTFDLTTAADYITLPDGNVVYMYGYKLVGTAFQHPSPVLCVDEGDTVTIRLTNTLPRDVSIMFPGQHDVLADGEPASPQFGDPDAPDTLTSLTQAAPENGEVTYTFVADHPGTFLYESGTDPDVQVRMGLFGALIVRPTMGDDYAYNRADDQFTVPALQPESTGANNAEEFLVLLSEIDPYLNQAIERKDQGRTSNYSLDNYHPRYWLVNGRGFPDSIADNGASWLPNQPYGALAQVRESDSEGHLVGHPHGGLARYLNVGTETYPFHPHGNNGKVIGRDGRPLETASGADLSYEKFAIDIGPGQTYDVLFRWYDGEHYDPATNPVPVEVPQVANQVFGMFYSGSPYLGVVGPQPPGNQTLNQCGEYYIISHNHALYQITSWGVNMTGPITYMRIDPDPATSNCP
jgi:FtsP/CotA-like multicopper oxidase with cupredoxin domain